MRSDAAAANNEAEADDAPFLQQRAAPSVARPQGRIVDGVLTWVRPEVHVAYRDVWAAILFGVRWHRRCGHCRTLAGCVSVCV